MEERRDYAVRFPEHARQPSVTERSGSYAETGRAGSKPESRDLATRDEVPMPLFSGVGQLAGSGC